MGSAGMEVSRPRARRWVRWLVLAGLLGLALAAIWWIDRGATRRGIEPAGQVPASGAGAG